MKFSHKLEGVLPAIDVIRAATCIAAELFRMEEEIGVVAPGSPADLIAVSGNPFDEIGLLGGQGEGIDLVMKDGVIHKMQSIDGKPE
jgi:imidazolonepropionase-like amidohydrolase